MYRLISMFDVVVNANETRARAFVWIYQIVLWVIKWMIELGKNAFLDFDTVEFVVVQVFFGCQNSASLDLYQKRLKF